MTWYDAWLRYSLWPTFQFRNKNEQEKKENSEEANKNTAAKNTDFIFLFLMSFQLRYNFLYLQIMISYYDDIVRLPFALEFLFFWGGGACLFAGGLTWTNYSRLS